MRVASMQTVTRYQTRLNDAWERSTKYMEQADGNRIHRPSDDSVAYAKYLRYEDSLGENEQYQSNVKSAISWMKSADDVLVNMTDMLKTITAKAVNAANETNNDTNLKDIGIDVLYKVQEIVALGNTQSGDRYLFSGQADQTSPFSITTDKSKRGIVRTLNDAQATYFSQEADATGNTAQMLGLKGDDGNNYVLSTITGNIYTEYFFLEGYKNEVAKGNYTESGANRVGHIDAGTGFVKQHFDNHGVLTSTPDATIGTAQLKDDAGTVVATVNLHFDYLEQYICSYHGDTRHISMVKKNGPVDVTSDTVNITGQQLFGSNIFDNENSGNADRITANGETFSAASGTAAINDLLQMVAKMEAVDFKWMSSDGITVADTSHATVVHAQTGIAARHDSYDSVLVMLQNQNEVITNDITDVTGTDVAQLAVKMMEAQTLYNMMLSVGARILPQSLADFL